MSGLKNFSIVLAALFCGGAFADTPQAAPPNMAHMAGHMNMTTLRPLHLF